MTTTWVWTDERVADLKQHWLSGASCSEIGAAMGTSRNSIVGKVHRIGLDPRRAVLTPEQAHRRNEQRKQADAARNASRVMRQRKARNQFREDKPMQELPPAPPAFEGSLNLPFNDLRAYSSSEPNECRFIAAGGPDFLACGTVTPPGESWCSHCRAIVYVHPINITAAERERRSRQATRNWKATEVKLNGTAEVAAL